MHAPILSVIIPVYNVDRYLEECLDSILNQSLRDIELICVNDGSKDGSLAILQRYAQKDERLVVVDKPNSGAGASRNAGLELAKGEYVLFFDSDDWFSRSDALSLMYEKARESDADIVVCRSREYAQESKEVTDLSWSINEKLIEYRDARKVLSPRENARYILQCFVGWPWDKLYRREFLQQHQLQYQNLRHSNDTFFVLSSLVLAETICVADESLIMHRKHTSSLESTRIRQPNCFYLALQALKQKMVEQNLFEVFRQSYINYAVSFSCWHISTVSDKKARREMSLCLRWLWTDNKLDSYPREYFYDAREYQRMKRKQGRLGTRLRAAFRKWQDR